jgi:hypothetical protein
MKYVLLFGLFLGTIFIGLQGNNCFNNCKAQAISKTSLANTQAPFSSVSPEMVAGFRVDRIYARQEGKNGTVQAVLFGSQSTHSKNLARYFFPHGKDILIVAEDDLADNFDKKKDLLAQHFNIFTNDGNFRSEISIAPQQTVVGCGFHWIQSLWRHELIGKGLWMSFSAPIVHVKNKMNLKENVINNGGGPNPSADINVMSNMIQALDQQEWCFGKITQESRAVTRLADIEFKLGYDDWVTDESSHLELYIGAIIPTGNKMKGHYVFEPIAGRGKYAGIMLGSSFGKKLWTDFSQEVTVSYEMANHTEYLFKGNQIRSFDLVDKQWSRYIEMYVNVDQAIEAEAITPPTPISNNLATPGINILTQKVSVTPGFSCDINGAFIATRKQLQAEFGYNLFFRRAECVKLACPWATGPAIKYTSGLGETNPIRDITGNKYFEQIVLNESGDTLIPVALSNFEQSLIMQEDIDIESASTPAVLSHTVYGAFGCHLDDMEHPVLANLGGSYTFAQNNAVIHKWMLWIKGGVSF